MTNFEKHCNSKNLEKYQTLIRNTNVPNCPKTIKGKQSFDTHCQGKKCPGNNPSLPYCEIDQAIHCVTCDYCQQFCKSETFLSVTLLNVQV